MTTHIVSTLLLYSLCLQLLREWRFQTQYTSATDGEEARGCRLEHQAATDYGLKILYEDTQEENNV